ncbi:MAG: hypothetical protein KKH98_07645 [Spirochaetes bacterium]|nr:hypothetical protein [Spirochaetota bacterium]
MELKQIFSYKEINYFEIFQKELDNIYRELEILLKEIYLLSKKEIDNINTLIYTLKLSTSRPDLYSGKEIKIINPIIKFFLKFYKLKKIYKE